MPTAAQPLIDTLSEDMPDLLRPIKVQKRCASAGPILQVPKVHGWFDAPNGMRVKLSKVGPFFRKVWAFSLVVAAVAQESFVKAVGLFDAGG